MDNCEQDVYVRFQIMCVCVTLTHLRTPELDDKQMDNCEQDVCVRFQIMCACVT